MRPLGHALWNPERRSERSGLPQSLFSPDKLRHASSRFAASDQPFASRSLRLSAKLSGENPSTPRATVSSDANRVRFGPSDIAGRRTTLHAGSRFSKARSASECQPMKFKRLLHLLRLLRNCLLPGGTGGYLSFHSGEDRPREASLPRRTSQWGYREIAPDIYPSHRPGGVDQNNSRGSDLSQDALGVSLRSVGKTFFPSIHPSGRSSAG